MTWTVAGILVAVWIVALATGNMFGGYAHGLLALAIVVGFVSFLKGKSLP